MASSKADGGIPKTRSATAKEKEKENTQKLADAVGGNLDEEKARIANLQANVVTATRNNEESQNQGQHIQTQSKREFNLPEAANNTAEPQDIEMGQTPDSHPEGYPSDGPEPRSSKSTASNLDDEPILLADFKSLSLRGDQDGVVDGFGGKGRGRFFIFRDGPRNTPKYNFERTNACSTEGFKNLSHHRISLLKYEDDREEVHYQYTRENMEGVCGIAIEERDEMREYKQAPQTWIKIRWRDIIPEHKSLN